MRGRIYDPLLGRFLTADPIVSNPLYGQAYNRYSYVLNNPGSLSDPTGLQNDRGSENNRGSLSDWLQNDRGSDRWDYWWDYWSGANIAAATPSFVLNWIWRGTRPLPSVTCFMLWFRTPHAITPGRISAHCLVDSAKKSPS